MSEQYIDIHQDSAPEPMTKWLPPISTAIDVQRVNAMRDAVFGDGSEFRRTGRELLVMAEGRDKEIVEQSGKPRSIEEIASDLDTLAGFEPMCLKIAKHVTFMGKLAAGFDFTDADLESGWFATPSIGKRLFSRGKTKYQQVLESRGETAVEHFLSASAVDAQFSDAFQTVGASLGLASLSKVKSRHLTRRLALDYCRSRLSRGMSDIASESGDVYEQAIARSKLYREVHDKLYVANTDGRLRTKETELGDLIGTIGKTVDDWRAEYAPHKRVQAEALERIALRAVVIEPEELPTAATESVSDNLEPKAETINVKTDSPELVSEETNVDELKLHSAKLKTAYDDLQKTWFNKRALKSAGFHAFTQAMINGVELEGVVFHDLPRDEVWKQAGILLKVSSLLSEHDFSAARNLLDHDLTLESALTQDASQIDGLARHKDPQYAVPSSALRRNIESSLNDIIDNWDAYSMLIGSYWPEGLPVDVERLEALLFNLEMPNPVLVNEVAAETPTEQVEPPEIDGPEIPDDEVPTIDLKPELTEIARQLDWVVFPPGSLEEIRDIITDQYPKADVDDIDWGRIEDLLTLRDYFSGDMYRSKDRTLGNTKPYFVMVCEIEGKTFAVAENPQYANATYIVREDTAGGTWKEVLELSRQDARRVGGHQLIHSRPTEHLQRIINKIQDLLTVMTEHTSR